MMKTAMQCNGCGIGDGKDKSDDGYENNVGDRAPEKFDAGSQK